MRIYIDGTINPTCLRVGIFLFGKPRFVRQVYPRKRKHKKTKWRIYLRRLLKQVLKIFAVEQLRAQILFGLEDAAATALGTGAIYSIWGHIFALLQTYHPVKKVHFEVKPIYQKMFFSAICLKGVYIRNGA